MGSFVDTDVVIVGAGLAGLTAANRAAEYGYRVLVLEAGSDEKYLCNSRIASGSFSLAHSDPTSSPASLYDAILGDTENAADTAQARAIAECIGSAMAWFRQEGAKFIKVTRAGRTSTWSMAPPRSAKPGLEWLGRGPDVALSALGQNFIKRGGQILLGTRARELIMAEGTCLGVRTEGRSEQIEVRARHTVLADGGFQGSPDLVRRFISPCPEKMVSRNAGTSRGDALIMAEKIGAKLVGMNKFYGHLLVQEALKNHLLWPYPTIDTLASSAVIVNRKGERLLDEGIGGVTIANIIAQLEDPLSVATIFDQAIWETTGKAEFTAPNPHLVTCGGMLTTATTIEDLAVALGLPAPALGNTIQTYNRAVQSGDLSTLTPGRTPGRMFGVLRSSASRTTVMPIVRPPFHAIRLVAGLTYTMGGIAIDDGARVLDARDRPIAGLYAAGSCTGGLEGGPAAGYVGGLCKALGLGFIAAQTIAAQDGAKHGKI